MVEECTIEEVSGTKFNELIQNGETNTILDVRSHKDFVEGHIQNAIHVDILSPFAVEELTQLSKEQPVLLYCNSGIRSRSACKPLQSLGFTKIYHLTKGLEDWNGGLK